MNFNQNLNIKIFADGADINFIEKYSKKDFINGFTTNPTLMKKAGVLDYEEFCMNSIKIVGAKEISFEVFADEIAEMEIQAREISKWGRNCVVKIPITNTKKESTSELVGRLAKSGVKCNITAVFTIDQLQDIKKYIDYNSDLIISIFAGRIADTGIDPTILIREAINIFKDYNLVKILWASPRELLNLFQAENCGCHIITLADDLLSKFELIGKNLEVFSLETVKMFYNDALKSDFKINIK